MRHCFAPIAATGSASATAQASPRVASYEVEWVCRIRYGSADARWDCRIVITCNGHGGSIHEGEVGRALFPDRATLRRGENRRWELTASHRDLPLHAVDPHAGAE